VEAERDVDDRRSACPPLIAAASTPAPANPLMASPARASAAATCIPTTPPGCRRCSRPSRSHRARRMRLKIPPPNSCKRRTAIGFFVIDSAHLGSARGNRAAACRPRRYLSATAVRWPHFLGPLHGALDRATRRCKLTVAKEIVHIHPRGDEIPQIKRPLRLVHFLR
jgi:hypothetical protein